MRVKPSSKAIKDGEKKLQSLSIYKYLIHLQSTTLSNNHYLALLYVYNNSGCRYYDVGNWYKWTTSYTYICFQYLVSNGYVSIVHTGTKTTYTTLTELGMKVCKSLLSIK